MAVATRKERNAASALSGQNPEGAARLGELLRYEFGSRRPVLTQIRALHFIPNGTRSHSRLFMKWVLNTKETEMKTKLAIKTGVLAAMLACAGIAHAELTIGVVMSLTGPGIPGP